MALYRNIAGFVDNGEAIGLTLIQLPTTFPTISDLRDPIQHQLDWEQIHAQQWASKNEKYDWLLSHTPYEVQQAGYYVTPDNGSIFVWTDTVNQISQAYLPIQDIQEIENARGTAGALLMHLREPILAKDTAGYAGGGSASGGSTTQYSDPIPEVKAIPDPELPDGAVPFEPEIPIPIPTGGGSTTTTTPTTTNTSAPASTTQKTDWLPLLATGAVVFTILAGGKVFKKRRKLVFLGGLGAMYYLYSKQE